MTSKSEVKTRGTPTGKIISKYALYTLWMFIVAGTGIVQYLQGMLYITSIQPMLSIVPLHFVVAQTCTGVALSMFR